MRRAIAALACAGLVAGCGTVQGALGAIGLGGGGAARTAEAVAIDPDALVPEERVDPTVLMPSIARAASEKTLRGALIRVEGVAPTQGYHSAVLVPRDAGQPDQAGMITFEFRARAPETPQAQGPQRTRLVTAAAHLSDRAVARLSGIRVVSAGETITLPVPR